MGEFTKKSILLNSRDIQSRDVLCSVQMCSVQLCNCAVCSVSEGAYLNHRCTFPLFSKAGRTLLVLSPFPLPELLQTMQALCARSK